MSSGQFPSDKNNYRPISLVSTFSKILENVVSHRLTNSFNVNNLFNDSQYGFRTNLSTEMAVLDLTHYVIDNTEKKTTNYGSFYRSN